MNENLNLCLILKDCSNGTKLYCTFLGYVLLSKIEINKIFLHIGNTGYHLYIDGTFNPKGECVLFPSKEQRDWSKFKVPIKKFNPKDFKPFDKVLVRRYENYKWEIDFFQRMENNNTVTTMISTANNNVIPFNEETEYLISSADDCPEYYKWWEK